MVIAEFVFGVGPKEVAGVSFVPVGVVAVSAGGCGASELTVLLRFDRSLIASGWVALPFFHFSMTSFLTLVFTY